MTTASRTATADAAELYDALSALIRVYQFRDRDRICCHDVSVTQCYAMEALLKIGPCSLNAMAAELYLDKSTASRVVTVLERKGHVTRRPDPDDARAMRLEITPAGRRLHDRIRSELVAEQAAMIEDLGPAARHGAVVLLQRLSASAAARSGLEPGVGCAVGQCG
jgi:DNA-binding MarR family transcriptional regulator